MENTLDFTFEFHTEIRNLRDELEYQLRAEAKERLLALAEGQTDLVGASVVLEELARGESPYLYEACVVVYGRPDHLAAVEKDSTPESTLRAAIDAAERQVRERREKLSERWKQP